MGQDQGRVKGGVRVVGSQRWGQENSSFSFDPRSFWSPPPPKKKVNDTFFFGERAPVP